MKKLKEKHIIFLLEQMASILTEGKLEITATSKKEKEESKKSEGVKICFDAAEFFNDPKHEYVICSPSVFAPVVAEFHIGRTGRGPLLSFRQGIKLCQIIKGDDIPNEDLELFDKLIESSATSSDSEKKMHDFFWQISKCGKIVTEKRQKEKNVKIGELNYFK